MIDSIKLIKKSKVLTAIGKALFGADVKAVFVSYRWYTRDGKSHDLEQLKFKLDRLESSNQGFERHKDNTGTRLSFGDDEIIIEYKDGRLLEIQGGDWSSAMLIPRDGIEVVD